jgi:hypothetical protein
MTQRAVDYPTAQEVFVAVELARQGAAAPLIERLTGFGPRWVRGVVRAQGGALAMKLKDPVRWFEGDPQRLLHARYVQMAYERQPANEALGRRLLTTYVAYRRVVPNPGLLGINECAQLIDLIQRGDAWVRDCLECQQKHLVIGDRATCPLCRFIERESCRGCGGALPIAQVRQRAYCDSCSPSAVRQALRRRTRAPRAAVSDSRLRAPAPALVGRT